MTVSRQELKRYIGTFVRLIFRSPEGETLEIPMAWIKDVGVDTFIFKPSAVEELEAPFDKLVYIEETFPGERRLPEYVVAEEWNER